ncbi:MAG: 5'/3'-nucleotidase SurE, partial [Candidatus Thermoplasmatota archaeon]|nr:5'/3'-nucleotidase SurE [Candidatus Thermoplasmatota archaeon]
RKLHSRGHPLAVLAPASEQSASGMRLTLHSGLKFENRNDLLEKLDLDRDGPPIEIYSLDGTPCDCVIVALDGGFEGWAPAIRPRMCISGINRGPNISIDIMHSGTVSAAREAALYGMPSLAVSLATYLHEDYSVGFEVVGELIDACLSQIKSEPTNLNRPRGSNFIPWSAEGIDMQERLREAFRCGDIFFNLNLPHEWSGNTETVRLGARWYLGATSGVEIGKKDKIFKVGAASIQDEEIPQTDCHSIMTGNVAITPLATWPQSHPLSMPDAMLHSALESNENGLPSWL